MARGRRPTNPHLKLVTGNPGRRQIPTAPAPEARSTPLEPPKKLNVAQRRLWDRFIETATWLTDFDVPKAYMWVCLQAEHDRAPAKMLAARLTQLRLLAAELGLDPGARSRMAIPPPESKSPADEFF